MHEILSHSSVSMTSKEIAELVESRHADVKRSVDRLVERQVISKPPVAVIEEINNLGLPVSREIYVFDAAHKRDSIVVVAQLSPEFTGRLVDRWQELEAAVADPAPKSYIEAVEQLLQTLKSNEVLAAKNKALETDNSLLNTIIDNEFGYCSILKASQHLHISENEFSWHRLKKQTLLMGLEVKKVPSPRYEYQNLYPIAAFEHCYPQYDFSGIQPDQVASRAMKLLSGQLLTAAH